MKCTECDEGMPTPYECESDVRMCKNLIAPAAWAILDPWRNERDKDDLYIVCMEHAHGFEVLRAYGGACVIRDRREDGRRVNGNS